MTTLTKEECLEALRYLSDYNGEEFNGEKFANAIEDLHELINEHFDNTPDFKGFKLHSKSYLNTFKKEELIDYIYMVYRNWQGTDSACNHVMKYAEKLQKINDELQRVVDESKETRSNPPLKFDELHDGMWVWDNLIKEYKKIYGKEIKYNEEWVEYRYDFVAFEENRFYRYQVKGNK